MQGPWKPFRKNGRTALWSGILIIGVFFLLALSGAPAVAQETLTIATSSQVYEAFKDPGLDEFRKQANAQVVVDVMTSEDAIARLSNGFCDIAATAQSLDNRLKRQGFVEIPLAEDDFAILTHPQTTVKNITNAQLKSIFAGNVKNWNQVGGPDKPLLVITPSERSASYRNFQRLVMDGHDMNWDIMTSQSTMAAEVIRRFPWAVTFVAQSATHGKPQGSKIIQINGLQPGDAGYPYVQTFSLVTKGAPAGLVKDFVDYVKSEKITGQIREMGMRPLSN